MKQDTYLVIIIGCLVCLTIFLAKVNLDQADFTSMMIQDYKELRSEVVNLGGFQ
jgi:hypothetical protein